MAESFNGNKFCFIIGSTASGKSRLAESLSTKFSAPLLNADSVQAYKHLSIGAAKPSAEDLKGIRHYLFDLVEYPNTLTAGEFFRETEKVLAKLLDDRIFFIVGGSGFYIQALVNGMAEGSRSNADMQDKLSIELKVLGQAVLYERLCKFDPEAAKKISPNDHYRLLRYLELAESTGRTMKQRSEVNKKNLAHGGLNRKGIILKIGLSWEREELLKRVKKRVDLMFDMGFVEEVQGLLDRGMGKWSPMQSVGYKQISEVLNSVRSEESLETLEPLKPVELVQSARIVELARTVNSAESVESARTIPSEDWVSFVEKSGFSKNFQVEELKILIVNHTMQLAKKQKTWWKKDPSVLWIKGETPLNEQIQIVEQALDDSQR